MKLHFAQHQFVVSTLNFQGVNRWCTKSLKDDHMKHRITPSKTQITDDWDPKRNEVFFGSFCLETTRIGQLGEKIGLLQQKKHYSSDLEGFLGTTNA